MAKFTVSDVMEKKVDGKSVGYNIVIECEGTGGSKVSSTLFVDSKQIPEPSKSSIVTIAESYLKEKEGAATRADSMVEKAVNITTESVKSLIPTTELSVDAKVEVVEDIIVKK
jgi:hypothetical protein